MTNTSNGPENRNDGSRISDGGYYFSVPTDTLNPDTNTGFPVYLKRGSRYVLYSAAHDLFTRDLKERLVQNGVETVYIPLDNQASYESYVLENLEDILNNPAIPDDVRSKVFLDTTAGQVREIFETRTPCLDNKMIEGVHHLVKSSLSFLLTPSAMENIRRFLSHDYQTFSHSVHVFTYTMMLMNYLSEDWDEETLVDAGVGALLHDIGKTKIPASVLNKP
ncbi:MAG: HD-GYP domain-containing protein, partial [Desulfosalsimonas sp.]